MNKTDVNKTEITGKITVQQTKTLFWPIIWAICVFSIGIPWLTWRLHENSKITGNTIPRNIMLGIIAVFVVLFFISLFFGGKDSDSSGSTTASQPNEHLTKLAQ